MDTDFSMLNRDALLAKLVAFITLSYDRTIAPVAAGVPWGRSGKIPQALIDSRNIAAGFGSVALSYEESEAYSVIRHTLSRLRETEWLSADELDGKLWELACDIALSPGDVASEVQRVAQAQSFLGQVLRELRPYQIVLTLDHLAPPSDAIALWDVQIAAGTAELMQPFVTRVHPDFQEEFSEPFVGKAVLLTKVEGTAARPVIERARQLAHHRLHVLRAGLAKHWQTGPEQLLFRLGEHAFARTLSGPPEELRAWTCAPATPRSLEIHAGHAERLEQLEQLWSYLAHAHASVRDPVERACEWIGRGMCRHWPGDALRDYTTALEVLLITSKEERNKSFLVVYRMLALAELHGQAMIHPAAVRHAYDQRSDVVHEGKAGKGDEQATRRMLGAARDCIGWLATFAAAHPADDHETLVSALDTQPLRDKTIAWLEMFADPWSQRLLKGIRSLPK